MARFYANAAVWVTLTLLASCFDPDQVFAASPAGATDAPEKTVPQGTDPALKSPKGPTGLGQHSSLRWDSRPIWLMINGVVAVVSSVVSRP